MLTKKKSLEEARFDFMNMFTTLHSANSNFKDQRTVNEASFIEYHAIVNTQIERDCDFRNLIVGVWNMDVLFDEKQKVKSMTHYIDEGIAGKKSVAFPAKNSHVTWQHDFHRSLFGQQSLITHNVSEKENKKFFKEFPPAGVRNQDFASTKGI